MARPLPPKPNMPNTGRRLTYDPPPPGRVPLHKRRPARVAGAVIAGAAVVALADAVRLFV